MVSILDVLTFYAEPDCLLEENGDNPIFMRKSGTVYVGPAFDRDFPFDSLRVHWAGVDSGDDIRRIAGEL